MHVSKESIRMLSRLLPFLRASAIHIGKCGYKCARKGRPSAIIERRHQIRTGAVWKRRKADQQRVTFHLWCDLFPRVRGRGAPQGVQPRNQEHILSIKYHEHKELS